MVGKKTPLVHEKIRPVGAAAANSRACCDLQIRGARDRERWQIGRNVSGYHRIAEQH
ncbi:hypothetical protein [Nitrobacter winogradskyi]|uniref:hypothetical protein n=1 Tax=Nitrobacter winogradskyi TaxID=913 RepID=UPI00164FEB98|nr:hypothetical protein [Nitrobacter winogradskyi]